MKKLLIVLTAILGMWTINASAAVELPEKTDREPVKVYLFYADYCSHCHDFIKYFMQNYKDEYKDYFEIVGLESAVGSGTTTSEVRANYNVSMQLKEYFKIADTEFGWPFIVVGDYHVCGFGSDGTPIIEQALAQYKKKDYEDIVAKYLANNKEVKPENLQETAVTAGVVTSNANINTNKTKEEGAIPDGVYVAIIFVVIIGGLGGLVLLARKK